jgi:hypothetical protein
MLEGLELGNPSTAGQETPQMQSGSEAGIHVEMPPSTTNVEIVSLSSGASTGARGSRQEQPAVGRKVHTFVLGVFGGSCRFRGRAIMVEIYYRLLSMEDFLASSCTVRIAAAGRSLPWV